MIVKYTTPLILALLCCTPTIPAAASEQESPEAWDTVMDLGIIDKVLRMHSEHQLDFEETYERIVGKSAAAVAAG